MSELTTTVKNRTKSLGINTRVLKNTKCPECSEPEPNCLFSAKDGKFHVVCSECNHQAEGDDFEGAIYMFDAVQRMMNSEDYERSEFLDSL